MTIPWILAGVLGVMLIVQGVLLRAAYRRQLASIQSRHAQYQREVNAKFDTMRRQVGQLQDELAAAKRVADQADEAAAPPRKVDPALARQALERELEAGEAVSRATSGDGFADTQVSMHDGDDAELLLR